MSTFALVDGGLSVAEYLWANGIRPAHILFSIRDLEDSITYCDPETDSVLFIVNGCTELSYDAVKQALDVLNSCQNIKEVTIFSNIPIYAPRFNMAYILFEGDLMTGTEYLVNTSMRITSTSNLKAIKAKDNRINRFKIEEATEGTVDIGVVPHKFIEPMKDSVPRNEIIQLDIFDKTK